MRQDSPWFRRRQQWWKLCARLLSSIGQGSVTFARPGILSIARQSGKHMVLQHQGERGGVCSEQSILLWKFAWKCVVVSGLPTVDGPTFLHFESTQNQPKAAFLVTVFTVAVTWPNLLLGECFYRNFYDWAQPAAPRQIQLQNLPRSMLCQVSCLRCFLPIPISS
jgi:hypothetical protein